jgi:hypothetical protein
MAHELTIVTQPMESPTSNVGTPHSLVDWLGLDEGASVGLALGLALALGLVDGEIEGDWLGLDEGASVGLALGLIDGGFEGDWLGLVVEGVLVGLALGLVDGLLVVGALVGGLLAFPVCIRLALGLPRKRVPFTFTFARRSDAINRVKFMTTYVQ